MPKSKATRQRTGCVRKQPLRKVQEQYRHTHGLTTSEVTLRTCFQVQMSSANHASTVLCNNAVSLATASVVARTNQEKNRLLREARILMAMQRTVITPIEQHYFRKEALLCDVPPAIHQAAMDFGPKRHRTIDSLTDYEALHFTNFTKPQLRRIYRCFNFGHADVRIHCSQGNYYKEKPEYIFLFGLVKCCQGDDNIKLCYTFFGGSPRRMSNVFKYFLIHLHDRYYDNVLSYQGLEAEVSNFGYFATKIARKVNQERFLIKNTTYNRINVDSITVNEENFRVCCFIDGSVTETTTLGTGPNGDYVGSMRKDDAYIKQRSIYSGYKKQHGLSTLDIMLPNGMNYIYGPCSMRRSDRSMVTMSEFNSFFETIQQTYDPGGKLFASYGDKLFYLMSCVLRAHKGDALNPLTPEEYKENKAMNSVRITIEHAFAFACNIWKIMLRWNEFKLGQENPHTVELLSVCYLLANISVTLNGSQVGGDGSFLCPPPSLEDYLEQGDEGPL